MIQVIWSEDATEEILNITSYWNRRNNSLAYSQKIKFHTEIAINLIKKRPQLGIPSNKENVRMRLILKHFYLIYEIGQKEIIILRFWDVRQNPLKMNLKEF